MMSSGDEERGMPRLLLKLKEAIQLKKFYEAHQLIRTINFRYRSANKLLELESLLIKTAMTLLDTEQYESGSDVANMLTKLYLDIPLEVNEDRLLTLSTLLKKMQDSPERAMFIANTIEWSSKFQEMGACGMFNSVVAQIYLKQDDVASAWKHVTRMTDAQIMSEMTLEICEKSSIPPEERDLVIAILVLNLICGKRNSLGESVFSKLLSTVSPSPLLNGVKLLLLSCESSNVAMYNKVKKIYWPSFNRESNVARLVTTVGKIIFKIQTPSRNGFMTDFFTAFAEPDSPQRAQQAGVQCPSETDHMALD